MPSGGVSGGDGAPGVGITPETNRRGYRFESAVIRHRLLDTEATNPVQYARPGSPSSYHVTDDPDTTLATRPGESTRIPCAA